MLIKVDKEKEKQFLRAQQEEKRKRAYAFEADPLAIESLRDETKKEEWLAKVEEIKKRYPYPE
jgi:hypothetical protein